MQPWFAYPLNADLLSLWPTLLQQGIELTTFPQLATAGLGALVVVAFARGAGVTRRSAAFAGLLYALLPVTLRQASSCYTDLTVAAFFGAAALGAARFFTTGAAGALLLAGLGAGLLAGTKYNMLFAALLLLPLIFARLRSQAHRAAGIGRAALLFAAPVAGLSGYWLLRNWIVLGNPCFPYPVGIGPLTLFAGALPPRSPLVDSPPLLLSALRAPATLWRISLTDCGLGSVDGGLGPVLWGAVLPFGVVFTLVVLARWRRHRDAAGIVLAAPFIAGLAPYVLAHTVTAGVTTRFLLSAAIPGLAILVLGLARLRERSPIAGRAAMIGIAAVAALGVVQLGGNQASNERKQSMDLGPAASRARAASASPWSLVQEGAFGPNRLAPAWDFLDLVTAPAGAPTRTLWIYATSRYPAGFYGSRLQNRIWNFGAPDRPAQPEALVYYFSRLSGAVTIEESGDKIPWEQVAGRRETYEVVFFTPETAVFFRRELLAPGGDLWRRLLRYYEQVAPPLAEAAERLAQTTGPADTVVAVDPIGFSLKALEMDGRLKAQVLLAHRRELDALRLRPREGGLLWLVAPLAPGASSPVQELRVGDRVVGIFKMDAAAP